MKLFTVTFWRSNPQFAKGGYETTRVIEAKTISSAEKKAQKICDNCLYGDMSVLKVESK